MTMSTTTSAMIQGRGERGSRAVRSGRKSSGSEEGVLMVVEAILRLDGRRQEYSAESAGGDATARNFSCGGEPKVTHATLRRDRGKIFLKFRVMIAEE